MTDLNLELDNMKVSILEMENDRLKLEKEELESELGKLEDQNELLKEIIKSLAEVL